MEIDKLNSMNIADMLPIVEINEVFSQLGKNKFYAAVDVKSRILLH